MGLANDGPVVLGVAGVLPALLVATRHRIIQKETVEGGRGVAAHSISPRPLARAREICVPTFSDNVAVSAPALMAKAFAKRRH